MIKLQITMLPITDQLNDLDLQRIYNISNDKVYHLTTNY